MIIAVPRATKDSAVSNQLASMHDFRAIAKIRLFVSIECARLSAKRDDEGKQESQTIL
jgi:hypothetical protein